MRDFSLDFRHDPHFGFSGGIVLLGSPGSISNPTPPPPPQTLSPVLFPAQDPPDGRAAGPGSLSPPCGHNWNSPEALQPALAMNRWMCPGDPCSLEPSAMEDTTADESRCKQGRAEEETLSPRGGQKLQTASRPGCHTVPTNLGFPRNRGWWQGPEVSPRCPVQLNPYIWYILATVLLAILRPHLHPRSPLGTCH